jgi:hypothetical protein
MRQERQANAKSAKNEQGATPSCDVNVASLHRASFNPKIPWRPWRLLGGLGELSIVTFSVRS